MIKVLLVIDNLGRGGAQQQVMEFLRNVDRYAFGVTIVSLDKTKGDYRDQIKKCGFEVYELGHRGLINFKTLFCLIKLVRQVRPDIVHTYLYASDFYGRIAARLAGVRVIISSIRNLHVWKKRHHILADHLLARVTDAIIINAEALRDFVVRKEKIDTRKIITIYNGIDLTRFEGLVDPAKVKAELGIPVGGLLVGMVGRFARQKDYRNFLSAAVSILKTREDVFFVVVGEGETRQDLMKEFKHPKVIFTGQRTDIPSLINAMNLCVLSTFFEGCPNVIMEYMACSKPVIASNVGGCPELVQDGSTGYIVPLDNPDALAQKMNILLDDSQLREKFGINGRKRIEEGFTVGKMVHSIENIYRDTYRLKYERKRS